MTMQSGNIPFAGLFDHIKEHPEIPHKDEPAFAGFKGLYLQLVRPIAELYNRFKELVLAISPELSVKPMKQYITFRSKTNVADVVILKKSVKIFINLPKGKLDDPKKLVRDVSEVGHWGNGDYQITINTDDELEYIISLVRQSYKING